MNSSMLEETRSEILETCSLSQALWAELVNFRRQKGCHQEDDFHIFEPFAEHIRQEFAPPQNAALNDLSTQKAFLEKTPLNIKSAFQAHLERHCRRLKKSLAPRVAHRLARLRNEISEIVGATNALLQESDYDTVISETTTVVRSGFSSLRAISQRYERALNLLQCPPGLRIPSFKGVAEPFAYCLNLPSCPDNDKPSTGEPTLAFFQAFLHRLELGGRSGASALASKGEPRLRLRYEASNIPALCAAKDNVLCIRLKNLEQRLSSIRQELGAFCKKTKSPEQDLREAVSQLLRISQSIDADETIHDGSPAPFSLELALRIEAERFDALEAACAPACSKSTFATVLFPALGELKHFGYVLERWDPNKRLEALLSLFPENAAHDAKQNVLSIYNTLRNQRSVMQRHAQLFDRINRLTKRCVDLKELLSEHSQSMVSVKNELKEQQRWILERLAERRR